MILAGELARDPEARPTLSALAHRLGAPVLAAYRCQDVLDNSDSAYAGHLEINPVTYQNEALAAADAILVLGSRLDGITSREEALLADRPDRLIHVYPDAVVLDRFASGLAVLADVAPSLSALTAALPAASGNGAWQSDLHQAYLRFGAGWGGRAGQHRSRGVRRVGRRQLAGGRHRADRRGSFALGASLLPLSRPADPGRFGQRRDGRQRARGDWRGAGRARSAGGRFRR